MPRISLDIPAGLAGDDTSFAAAGRWRDASNVRFWRGLPEVIGGWETALSSNLTGVCRSAFGWTDSAAVLNLGFGAHSALQVAIDGTVYDITPTLALPPLLLAGAPLGVVNTTPNVTVAWKGHGLTTADTVSVSGAVAVGGITPNGGPFAITAVTTDTFTYTYSANATSTATGGGTAVVAAPQRALAAGSIDGTGGAGYGTGTYSTGTYSSPSTADYFPRTWSLAAWGENLIACPRAGAIYGWTNNTGAVAAPLANSPSQVTYMLVAPQDQVFALGCDEEVSGIFNPLCIRHSGIRNNTQWNTASSTTAREYILPGGGRIVAGRIVANYLLVWTTHSLFLGAYVGAAGQVWRFDRVGEKCGLIGPSAAVVVGQAAYWLGPDLQFRRYALGGAPEIVVCPIRDELEDNVAASQGDKIVAASTSKFGEVRFDYPDARDGVENSRYLVLSTIDGAWSRGVMGRTAYLDAGPATYPLGVTYSGVAYWHERGQSADGSAFAWFIETADQYLSEDRTMLVRGVWPDFTGQVGPVNITLTSRLKPQGDERAFGPYPMGVGEDKTDLRASGRLFKVRLAGNSSPTAARLGRLGFDVTPQGMR